jgi:hypothetical protein
MTTTHDRRRCTIQQLGMCNVKKRYRYRYLYKIQLFKISRTREGIIFIDLRRKHVFQGKYFLEKIRLKNNETCKLGNT